MKRDIAFVLLLALNGMLMMPVIAAALMSPMMVAHADGNATAWWLFRCVLALPCGGVAALVASLAYYGDNRPKPAFWIAGGLAASLAVLEGIVWLLIHL